MIENLTIEETFPFEKIRPQQEERIKFALESDKRFVILELPT